MCNTHTLFCCLVSLTVLGTQHSSLSGSQTTLRVFGISIIVITVSFWYPSHWYWADICSWDRFVQVSSWPAGQIGTNEEEVQIEGKTFRFNFVYMSCLISILAIMLLHRYIFEYCLWKFSVYNWPRQVVQFWRMGDFQLLQPTKLDWDWKYYAFATSNPSTAEDKM